MENPELKADGRVPQHNVPQQNTARTWIAVILTVLIATAGYSWYRLAQQDRERADLLRTNQALQSSLEQAKSDLRANANRPSMPDAVAPALQPTPPSVEAEPALPNPELSAPVAAPVRKAKKLTGKRIPGRGAGDSRWNQLDAKLAEQQRQIENAKSDISKTREDLEGRLGTTRDELSGAITQSHDQLSGAIAKTHDEVAELRKRGERNYHEFDLKKSSEFARSGPVSLSLRKANVKRKYYDIALIVDDQKIEKKHVNLFEPLWISVPNHPEPVQLVVNSITKDNVKGYLSESRYKKSELARNGTSSLTTANSEPSNASSAQTEPAPTDELPLKPVE